MNPGRRIVGRVTGALVLAAATSCVVSGCTSDVSTTATGPSPRSASSAAASSPAHEPTPAAAVAVEWDADMSARLFARTGTLRAHVTSARPTPLDVSIVAVERGAGEPATRLVDQLTLASGGTHEIEVSLADLPVQNVDAPLPLQLFAVFQEGGFQRRYVSPALNVVFAPDGKTLFASGLDSYGPLVAALAQGRADDVRVSALLRGAAPAATSRATLLAPARANAKLATRQASPDAAVPAVTMGAPLSVSGGLLPPSAETSPPIIIRLPTYYQFCSTWTGSFTDSHFGEDYLDEGHWVSVGTGIHSFLFWVTDPHPARFADAHVVNASSQTVWHGSLDASGCTPALAMTPGDYSLDLQTTLTRDTTTYDVYHLFPYQVDYTCPTTRMRGPLECQEPGFTIVPFHVNAGSPLQTVHVDVPPGPETSATRVAAVVGQILVTPDSPVHANDSYTVYADSGCNSSDPQLAWKEACADSVAYFGLGDNATHKDTTLEKFVVAHELGHQLQAHQDLLDVGSYAVDPTAPVSCGCTFVVSANTLHCLESRHDWLTASAEGWAHFWSQMTFNATSRTDPTFVYYKEVRTDDGVVHAPPYPVNAGVPVRWLANHCPASGDTVEWDVLTFLRALNGGGGTDALTMTDILGVYRAATSRTWPGMSAGALAYFGSTSNPKYQRFLRAGNASGVTY